MDNPSITAYDHDLHERRALLYLLGIKQSDKSNHGLVQDAIDKLGSDWTYIDKRVWP